MPALLDIAVREWMCENWGRRRVLMRVSGTPDRPKPPQRRVEEGVRDWRAVWGEENILLMALASLELGWGIGGVLRAVEECREGQEGKSLER